MYVTNVRSIVDTTLGMTLPAEMIKNHSIKEGKAIIRPLTDGSFNMVILSKVEYENYMKGARHAKG